MLSEINQTKTNTAWDNLYVESKKYNRLVSITKKKIHRYREQTCGDRGRRLRGTSYYVLNK